MFLLCTNISTLEQIQGHPLKQNWPTKELIFKLGNINLIKSHWNWCGHSFISEATYNKNSQQLVSTSDYKCSGCDL